MATTPSPLVWDFYRKTGESGVVGGVVHYYDGTAQSLFNSNGLKTQFAEIVNGHWGSANWSDEHAINNESYVDIGFDHPYNGIMFGAEVSGGNVYFVRYLYAMDCTDLISSGNISYKNDSAAVQFKANIMNINEAIFMDDATLYQPGAKITFNIIVGEEEPYAMCVAYLDSVDYNINSATVPISGRNSIGFKLMQSTFDDVTEISGATHQVVAKIMEMAGVVNYVVQEMHDSRKHEFKPDQTLMSGLEQVCDLNFDWKIAELPDGTVIVGSTSFVSNYQTNGYYIFKMYERGEGSAFAINRSLFKRKVKRSCDAAYTKVRITGRDADGNDLVPVIVPVENYSYWNIPRYKTYHESAPDGLTQNELQSYAEDVAARLQLVGIGEEFTCSLQPQLLIGDVAAFDNGDDTMTPLGIVTDVKHSFGKSGFTTDFATDTGGLLVNSRAALFTKTKSLNGYNRKQTLKDLIQVASGSSAAGPKATGATVIKIASGNKNAETLEGKTYQQIVQDAVAAVHDELPEYTEQDYGKVLVPGADGLTWKEVSVTAGDELIEDATNAAVEAALEAVQDIGVGTYVAPNIINYVYEHTTDTMSHSRNYVGTKGNRLLLLIMHRGEMVSTPDGWTNLGILTNAADYELTEPKGIGYVSLFTKICIGSESIEYEQALASRSITCIIEFEGVSGFEVLESTRQEDVETSGTCFACARASTRMGVWVATSWFWQTNNTYAWTKSDDAIWAISDNHGIEPRLGVLVDNRPTPNDFTFGVEVSNRHASAICVQTIPIKG